MMSPPAARLVTEEPISVSTLRRALMYFMLATDSCSSSLGTVQCVKRGDR
jgi:hypothetical protein